MKCNICGGRTLPRAKLCLPCRSALRRARDDTVSELLPLPRGLEAMAFPGARTVSRTLDLVRVRRARPHLGKPTGSAAPAPHLSGKDSPLRATAIALFALAIGFLAYGFAHQLRSDPDGTANQTLTPPAITVPQSTVSPATLAAEARRNTALAPFPAAEASTESAPAAEAPRVEPVKPRKISPAPRSSAKPESVAVAPAEVVPSNVAAAPKTANQDVAAAPAPDRWQSLSAALGRCSAGNIFSRFACEHAARVQFCEGHWGQVAQCPGGVVNDHGQ
jgi:hypothetical protein